VEKGAIVEIPHCKHCRYFADEKCYSNPPQLVLEGSGPGEDNYQERLAYWHKSTRPYVDEDDPACHLFEPIPVKEFRE
jgi:hypothetical protein